MQNSKLKTQNCGTVKIIKYISFALCTLSFALVLAGCGERYESTVYYYSPTWARDGKIVFIHGLQSVKKDALGTQTGSTYTEAVMSMTSAGASEALLFDTTGTPPYQMSCSPSRDYVAYLDNLNSGLFGKVVIRNISPTSPHTGLEKIELLFSPGIKAFDWSDDGNKIVYCTTQEVRIRDWNDYTGTTDALVTAESNLEFVSWRYGTRIAFVRTSGSDKVLSLIYSSGAGRLNLSAAASVDKPSVSASNTNEVFGIAGGSYCKVDTSAASPATTEVFANFKGQLPRLAPAADKAVYGKTGETSGIYLLDIAAKTETQVK